jgi:REP element-mobilizing transposase RayT
LYLRSHEDQACFEIRTKKYFCRNNFASSKHFLYLRSRQKKPRDVKAEMTVKKRKKNKYQFAFFAESPSAHGGELQKKRKGRKRRPLCTRYTIHLVVRSTKAKAEWSFLKPKNRAHIKRILNKFAKKWGVILVNGANVGNHLHLQIRLVSMRTYTPFIRAVTSAIAMAITGTSRWTPKYITRFWDYRPFTKIVNTLKYKENLKCYMKINRLEGCGVKREVAEMMVKGKVNTS